MKPNTNYTKSGSFNIAYQVVGDGPVDIIYIPGWVSNIDMMWAEPRLAGFLTRLTLFSRLILFDKRGTGLSDRTDEYSTMEERMDDINAVMDATNSKKAFLFSHSEGGSVSLLFSINYPERTLGVIGFGIFAKRRYSEDYPWAPTDEEREISNKLIEENWAHGNLEELQTLVPSLAHDNRFMEWLASYLRAGGSPKAALILHKQCTYIDVTDILSSIKVPTLLLFRKGDIEIRVEEGRYIADRITNSKLVEFEGQDHLFWTGDTYPILAEMEEFVTGIRPKRSDFSHSNTKKTRIDIEAIMANNFLYNLKVEEFAKLCGRSLSAFKRDFRNIYNTTPSRWIKTKRLEYSKKLLLESDLNINQICYECGFVNTSHYIKSFKAHFNIPPHQFRSSNFLA
ncbi:alpha/beta fold hydrolase [Psychroserpens sp.]|uniref:alpha/beta fold hydrolase n=1 Tax=Psychroserpens sp. TaxID=2020870 RepID=UPI001B0B8F90|nr:alpha/beta fold hydrolase [Psychroserpens sp.]MBO6606102.1 alpha/beta fold hydrolase [Psychroserpens sp.]MBO6630610.1 alpha/beta fold hydrolase [Psychroserpens sp.]MBO6652527.1 alpha/beta fold hydrolase [Psychroserpens sp.]MBO6681701.1 alpha/beta fold hydrolase [Psychroserpens sp.]MBO6749476.1 alpha/beta fold hydrolase [Psychroserpens sp.]